MLVHGRWFSPASSTTKTDRHDIAEILLKVALNTKIQIHSKTKVGGRLFRKTNIFCFTIKIKMFINTLKQWLFSFGKYGGYIAKCTCTTFGMTQQSFVNAIYRYMQFIHTFLFSLQYIPSSRRCMQLLDMITSSF